MDVDIIVVPYDSAHRGTRMGAGPEVLVSAGLPAGLERAGHRVTCTTLELDGNTFHTEIRAAFDLAALVANQVGRARAAGHFPLVLSGNCNSALGVTAALGGDCTVFWLDAHGDFNTPETTIGGFLDGMALSTITGRCWANLATRLRGFSPVAESKVWLLGARDLDPLERVALDASDIRLIPATQIGSDLARELRAEVAMGTDVYLHIDLDVLDLSQGRANGYAVSGGATSAMLHDFCRSLGTPSAATISAYDPALDEDGRIRNAAIDAVESLFTSR